MINWIWFGMLGFGILYALFANNISLVTESIVEGTEKAVSITLGLMGMLAFWSGMMRLASDAGLIASLGKLLSPLATLVFPKLPKNHPALGAVLLSMSANLLGLGNACTPLGIKAMEELQKLNSSKESCSDSMCTFLVITSSSLTLLPTTVFALRVAANASSPTEILLPTLFATLCSTTIALILDRAFRNR